MKPSLRLPVIAFVAAAIAMTTLSAIGQHSHHGDKQDGHDAGGHKDSAADAEKDVRELVVFPDALRRETLANMRDHLLALSEIQQALATDRFDLAAEIAESQLGMNSLRLHGAHEVARYMPPGMQQAGTAMHHGASRFALAVKDADVTRDLKPAMAALAETVQACVACHSGYRLQ